MEKLVAFFGNVSEQQAENDEHRTDNQDENHGDEEEVDSGDQIEAEPEDEQHLGNELLLDDDDVDDVIVEKTPGSVRAVSEREQPSTDPVKPRHLDDSTANSEMVARPPTKALPFEGDEEPADNAQPKEIEDDRGFENKGISSKLRPGTSKFDDNREQMRRGDVDRDGGRRVEYIPDPPPPRRFDVDHPRRVDGYEPPRREDTDFSRRGDAYDAQRRGDNFDQGRRIGGEGFVEQSRRGDGFDSRRGDGYDQRRVEGFDPRRSENFEQSRRADGFDPVKRSDVFDPMRRGEGFEQSKRNEGFDLPRRDSARWSGHDYRNPAHQYPGDRGPNPPDGGRYPPKVEIRHDYPRSGPAVESPRVPPPGDTGPHSTGWNKGGFSGPPAKDWGAERIGDRGAERIVDRGAERIGDRGAERIGDRGAERIGDRGAERDGVPGPAGGRYPPVRANAVDSGRGSGVPAGQGARGGSGPPETRWNAEGPSPDSRRGYPGRAQAPQIAVDPPAPARDNLPVRGREISSPGDFPGNLQRGREAEGPWGRGFNDQEEQERKRERKHIPNIAKDPSQGFSGQNQHPNGAFHGARSKSPPRQNLQIHDDRRPVREVVAPAHGGNFSAQPAPGGNFSSQPVLGGNFSAHPGPKTPNGTSNGKLSAQQPAAPLGPDKGRADQSKSSRWGNPVDKAAGISQSMPQPPVQGQAQQVTQPHQQQPHFQQQQAHHQQRTLLHGQTLPQSQLHQHQYQKQQQQQQQQQQHQQESGYKEAGRPDVSSGISQPGDNERADLRSNISVKKRKLEDEHSNQFHQAAASAPQNQEIQPVQNSDRQRHVVSLKGINTQAVRAPDSKVQPETGSRIVQKKVRTVRSDDFLSQSTTVTVTGIDMDNHKGSWGPPNKGRGGYNNGVGRGKGRG